MFCTSIWLYSEPSEVLMFLWSFFFAWLRWSHWLTCWERESGHEGVLTSSRLQWIRSLQHATTSHTAAGWMGWWRRWIPDREWGRATAQALMVPSTAAALSTSPPPPSLFPTFLAASGSRASGGLEQTPLTWAGQMWGFSKQRNSMCAKAFILLLDFIF